MMFAASEARVKVQLTGVDDTLGTDRLIRRIIGETILNGTQAR